MTKIEPPRVRSRQLPACALVVILLIGVVTNGPVLAANCDRQLPIADFDISIPEKEVSALTERFKRFADHNGFQIAVTQGYEPNDVMTSIWRDDLEAFATTDDLGGDFPVLRFGFGFYQPCDGVKTSAEQLQYLIGRLRGELADIVGVSIVQNSVPR